MNFVELKVNCSPELSEIIIAELSLFPFDAFEETEMGVLASCEEQQWEEQEIKALLDRYGVSYEWSIVPKTNWNQEWEKNYPPVKIGDQIYVRAHFHPEEKVNHQILITPKMSFGTGHHDTTSLMLSAQLLVDHQDKHVLDVGCGTGVLAILAHQLGASQIAALDIDEWAVENSRENFSLNKCEDIALALGDISVIKAEEQFDIILANINRNVLMEQLEAYYQRLSKSGVLLISGFYQEDVALLKDHSSKLGYEFSTTNSQNNWAMIKLKKA